ncbi:MAG: magnesium transporter, partial [Thermomicrobiales bacterium]
ILSRMSAAQAADVLEEIDPDDATDIFAELEPTIGDTILVQMEPAEAAEIRELMAYPPDTAGGIMTPAFVALSPDIRADQAIAALRRVAEEAETVNYVYVVDLQDRLLGVLSLHRLVLTPPATPVRDLMVTGVVTVPVDADQEDAARLVTEHDLLAIPVVDTENHLLGIITADDVADVLEEEATEDIERLGGSSPLDEPYLRASPSLLFRKRIVWLLVLFMAQFGTLSIYNRYTGILEEEVLLALFVPILIGTGGNVGSQTVTTIIRAMAVGEAAPRHILRIVGKESVTAVALGFVMALLMFGRGFWESDGRFDFGLTVGATVMALIVWSATVAAVLPLALSRFKVDPAVVSAPLITSLVDATGIIIYFSVAQAVMQVGQ